APAVRPQSSGDGAAWKPGKLPEPADSECLQLCAALPLERQQRERQRCEEVPDLVVAHDEELPATCDGGGCERGEPAAGGADAGIPVLPDGAERPSERGIEPSVQPLHPARLEVGDAERGRIDREARILERAHDLL